MARRQISSGSPYEPVGGYCRAVVAGPHVHVSGTAPVMPDGAPPADSAYGQTKRCLEIIFAALAEAGARPEGGVGRPPPPRPALRRAGSARPALFRQNQGGRHSRPVKKISPASITS